jgi:O-antigen/teichoic acid export membrane protein
LVVDRGGVLEFRRESLREQLHYGVPIAISVGVLRVNRWVDRYVIGFLMPFDAVGVYTNCSRELPVVRTIPHGATTGLIPQLTRLYTAGDHAGFVALWESLMAKVAMLAFPAFALTFVAAPDLVALLFTEDYLSGVGIFRLYLLVLPLRLCIYGGILRAMGDTRTFVRVITLALVTNLVLNYPLYLVMGWYGPAVATVLSEVLTIVLLTGKAATTLSVSALDIFPWRRLARTGLVACVCALPAFFVLQLPIARALRLLIATPAYLAVYVAVALLSRVMTRSDLTYLWSLVGGGEGSSGARA